MAKTKTKTTTRELALQFVDKIKERDSLPFNEQWEAKNAEADAIIKQVKKGKMNEFSDEVSQKHHWL